MKSLFAAIVIEIAENTLRLLNASVISGNLYIRQHMEDPTESQGIFGEILYRV